MPCIRTCCGQKTYIVQAKNYANFERDTHEEAKQTERILKECGYETRIVETTVEYLKDIHIPVWHDFR